MKVQYKDKEIEMSLIKGSKWREKRLVLDRRK